jgi:hypothetical protein
MGVDIGSLFYLKSQGLTSCARISAIRAMAKSSFCAFWNDSSIMRSPISFSARRRFSSAARLRASSSSSRLRRSSRTNSRANILHRQRLISDITKTKKSVSLGLVIKYVDSMNDIPAGVSLNAHSSAALAQVLEAQGRTTDDGLDNHNGGKGTLVLCTQ